MTERVDLERARRELDVSFWRWRRAALRAQLCRAADGEWIPDLENVQEAEMMVSGLLAQLEMGA